MSVSGEFVEVALDWLDVLIFWTALWLVLAAIAYADDVIEHVRRRQRERAVDELGRERLGMGGRR